MRASRTAFAAVCALSCGGTTAPASVTIAPLPAPAAASAPAAEEPTSLQPHPSLVRVNKTVRLPDSEWLVVEARDAGQEIKPNSDFDDEVKRTTGRFVQVHYKLTNLGTREEMVLDRPKIADSLGREFGPIDMESFYVPPKAKTIGLDTLQPSIQKDYWTVIEVPADATRLQFVVHGFSLLGEQHKVPLGL